jgi:glycosyltransferase involved in cell wall biosynthesis
MTILLINHYAGSPEMGMEFRPYFMAREWIRSGHMVIVLAADFSHIRAHNPQISNDFNKQNIDGIEYIWIKTRPYEGNGAQRVLNMFDFTRKIYFKAAEIAKTYNPDVVIASSTYPADNFVARKIARKSGAKHVYEVHDLWPLSPIELGGMSRRHPFIMLMQFAEDFAYKHADFVVSMLPKTREYMASRGLNLQKWHYIPNGVVMSQWENPVVLNDTTQQKIQEIRDKYRWIVAYTGTLGLANDLDTLLDAALELPPEMAIVIMGEGPEKTHLTQRITHEQLNQCFIFPSISKNEIPAFLSQMDFLYIGLKSEPLFRFGISPNKMIDYMMAGKPVIQAIDAGNNMVEEAQCGMSVAPENPKAVVQAIKHLMSLDAETLKQLGENGQHFAQLQHDYKNLAANFLKIFG